MKIDTKTKGNIESCTQTKKSKGKTPKIDLRVNALKARAKCAQQVALSRKKHFGEAMQIIRRLDKQFMEQTHGICPICGGKLHLHHTTPKGFRVYICEHKHPNRTFNTTRGTIFRNANLPIGKLASIRDGIPYDSTVRTIAFCTNTSVPTAHARRTQMLKMFDEPEKRKIGGHEIIVDETYLESRERNEFTKKDNDGNKIKKRGLSRDKACIYTAITEHGSHFNLKVEGNGKPTIDRTRKAMQVMMKLDEVGVIKSDGDKTYGAICEEYNVECESAKNGKGLAGINAIHAKLKNFLSKFWGIRMKHLQLYLNGFMHIADGTYLCFESKLTNIKSIFQEKFINYSMNC